MEAINEHLQYVIVSPTGYSIADHRPIAAWQWFSSCSTVMSAVGAVCTDLLLRRKFGSLELPGSMASSAPFSIDCAYG